MSDILRQVDEDLRKEKLTSLWNRFKFYIISITLLIILFVSVYQYIKISDHNEKLLTIESYYKASKNESIDKILDELKKIESSNKFSQNLINLKIADINILKGNEEKGSEKLQQIFKSDNKSILSDLALYKYSMLKIDQITVSELNSLIEKFHSKENNFHYLFLELIGVKNIIDGQYAEGRTIFESLLNDASVSSEIKIRSEKYINIIK